MANVVTLADIAKAKLFQQYAKNTIGFEPEIVNFDGQYLEIDFTKAEVKQGVKFLDNKLWGNFRPKPTGAAVPTVQIRYGKILVPWALKYVVIILLSGFIIGRFSK